MKWSFCWLCLLQAPFFPAPACFTLYFSYLYFELLNGLLLLRLQQLLSCYTVAWWKPSLNFSEESDSHLRWIWAFSPFTYCFSGFVDSLKLCHLLKQSISAIQTLSDLGTLNGHNPPHSLLTLRWRKCPHPFLVFPFSARTSWHFLGYIKQKEVLPPLGPYLRSCTQLCFCFQRFCIMGNVFLKEKCPWSQEASGTQPALLQTACLFPLDTKPSRRWG